MRHGHRSHIPIARGVTADVAIPNCASPQPLRQSRQLEDAAACTGCISLAAAAGPSLQDAGAAMETAAAAAGERGRDLARGSTPAHATAAECLAEAAEGLSAAASGLRTAGERLEAGTAGPA